MESFHEAVRAPVLSEIEGSSPAHARIGGAIATNSGGTGASRYGDMRENGCRH